MIGLSTGYHRAMVHISQCHAMHPIPFKIWIPFNISITISFNISIYPVIFSCNTSFKFLQPQHTIFLTQITIPQLKFPKPQTFHLSPSLIYINSQCHCQNTIPTYLSNHYSSITTTSQNNIYIVSQISLYENSRVWKAPDSLFCIKVNFKDFIFI